MFKRLWEDSEEHQRQRLIEAQLRKVMERHVFLQVELEKGDELRRSLLLSVEPEQRCICLDQLMPKAGLLRLQSALWTISWREQGTVWRFNASLLETKGNYPEQTYRLSMPTDLLHQQRRGAFRVQMRRRDRVSVLLKLADGRCVEGKLRDISATGLNASFKEGALGAEVIEGAQVEISLPGLSKQGALMMLLDISAIESGEAGESLIRGPIQIQSARGRQQLERFIASRQRLEQRIQRGLE